MNIDKLVAFGNLLNNFGTIINAIENKYNKISESKQI